MITTTATATRLYVRMTYIEGALIRLLGLAGRRGFDIASVQARRADCGGRYDIVLELLGSRSVETLARQIEKLYDVEKVEVVPEVHAQARRLAGQATHRHEASVAAIKGHIAV